jgi:hypothetical protein
VAGGEGDSVGTRWTTSPTGKGKINMSDRCGIWMGGPEEDGISRWTCGRPKGHPHDGALYARGGSYTAGNHQPKPQPQDEPGGMCWHVTTFRGHVYGVATDYRDDAMVLVMERLREEDGDADWPLRAESFGSWTAETGTVLMYC